LGDAEAHCLSVYIFLSVCWGDGEWTRKTLVAFRKEHTD
jgi:hypothetical protein